MLKNGLLLNGILKTQQNGFNVLQDNTRLNSWLFSFSSKETGFNESP